MTTCLGFSWTYSTQLHNIRRVRPLTKIVFALHFFCPRALRTLLALLHLCGPDRAIGQMRVFVCVALSTTYELNDL